MADDKKISDLTLNPGISGSEEIPTEKSGVNFKNTYTGLKDWLQSVLTLVTAHSELSLDDGTNPHETTKSDVGLGSSDNTSDADKPVSTAQQTALDGKQNILSEGAFVDGDKTNLDNQSNTNTGDQDLSGLQPNQTVTDFTDAFTIADGTNNVTLTMTNAVNKDVTVKATSFSNVGDRCVVSNLLGVGFPIIVPFDANIELVDTDNIANDDFGRKGLERVNDVGGKVQIQMY